MQPLRNDADIVQKLRKDKDVAHAKSLITLFHGTLMEELFALTKNEQLKKEDKDRLLRHYMDFIKGFNAGSVNATETVIQRAFSFGYEKGFEAGRKFGYQEGYKDGFKDGFAKGYADGCRDGYAKGNTDAWEEANKVIEALKKELAEAKNDNTAATIKAIGDVALGALEILLGAGRQRVSPRPPAPLGR